MLDTISSKQIVKYGENRKKNFLNENNICHEYFFGHERFNKYILRSFKMNIFTSIGYFVSVSRSSSAAISMSISTCMFPEHPNERLQSVPD